MNAEGSRYGQDCAHLGVLCQVLTLCLCTSRSRMQSLTRARTVVTYLDPLQARRRQERRSPRPSPRRARCAPRLGFLFACVKRPRAHHHSKFGRAASGFLIAESLDAVHPCALVKLLHIPSLSTKRTKHPSASSCDHARRRACLADLPQHRTKAEAGVRKAGVPPGIKPHPRCPTWSSLRAGSQARDLSVRCAGWLPPHLPWHVAHSCPLPTYLRVGLSRRRASPRSFSCHLGHQALCMHGNEGKHVATVSKVT